MTRSSVLMSKKEVVLVAEAGAVAEDEVSILPRRGQDASVKELNVCLELVPTLHECVLALVSARDKRLQQQVASGKRFRQLVVVKIITTYFKELNANCLVEWVQQTRGNHGFPSSRALVLFQRDVIRFTIGYHTSESSTLLPDRKRSRALAAAGRPIGSRLRTGRRGSRRRSTRHTIGLFISIRA